MRTKEDLEKVFKEVQEALEERIKLTSSKTVKQDLGKMIADLKRNKKSTMESFKFLKWLDENEGAKGNRRVEDAIINKTAYLREKLVRQLNYAQLIEDGEKLKEEGI